MAWERRGGGVELGHGKNSLYDLAWPELRQYSCVIVIELRLLASVRRYFIVIRRATRPAAVIIGFTRRLGFTQTYVCTIQHLDLQHRHYHFRCVLNP